MQHVRHEDLGVVAAPDSNAQAISLNRKLYTPKFSPRSWEPDPGGHEDNTLWETLNRKHYIEGSLIL